MKAIGYRRRLQAAIDFIEANLREPLPLRDVSMQANASLYHFHRLFRAFVGESLKEYIRHRRLDHAAQDLIRTKRPIIDIAFDYRYSTPESFLRAFKAMYAVTPSAFRKRSQAFPRHAKADLLAGAPGEKGASMTPQFVDRGAFTLLGRRIRTKRAACKQEVAGFWLKERESRDIGTLARAAGADALFGVCFGACEGRCARPGDDQQTFPYLIGWEAQAGTMLLHGLVELKVPASRYAIFAVHGGLKDIDKAMNLIYGSWLASTKNELSDSPVLEKYGPEWNGDRGTMEIWLPIRSVR